MKLVSIEDSQVGSETWHRATLEMDGHRVSKNFRVHPSVRAEDAKAYMAYALIRLFREAERDFAYLFFGDKWQEHARPGKFWILDDLGEQETALVNDARRLRPDLFS